MVNKQRLVGDKIPGSMYTHGKKVRKYLSYEGKLWTKFFLESKYVLTKLFN